MLYNGADPGCCPGGRAADLTVLNMHEWQWCRADALPPLLRLTNFTMCLASCAEHHLSYIPDTGVALNGIWQADASLVTPALQEVSFLSVPSLPCDLRFIISRLNTRLGC